eukprot:1093677-Rhodomonas_salina.1
MSGVPTAADRAVSPSNRSTYPRTHPSTRFPRTFSKEECLDPTNNVGRSGFAPSPAVAPDPAPKETKELLPTKVLFR